ncbi:putative c6 transcription protein [Diplogelasinospora grovesii]|uniref:C6 transcription protein n=1 Tax=Diplogelasinospora grovesii TaxID=303347 RepID=A0AAN6N923_9PEZI|nr:putative c6 transcription protein [Diplogelasinospora grovesii]
MAGPNDSKAADERSPLLAHNDQQQEHQSQPKAPATAPKTASPSTSKSADPAPAQPPAQIAMPPAAAPPAIAAPAPTPKPDTDPNWGDPAGLHIRGHNDENLVIFRRAIGINSDMAMGTSPSSLEQGRKHAVGIYAEVMRKQKIKGFLHLLISVLVYASHFSQVIIGASLTALGPSAGEHATTITVLGAVNTVVAGLLALVKGQGLPERLRKDQSEFRKLQDWIEETEALLAVGVIGRDRKEVGGLVQIAFAKYNAAKASEENNVPENYVRQSASDPPSGGSGGSGGGSTPAAN